MKLSIASNLSLKKPTKNNPLPIVVLYADSDGNVLGNLEDTNQYTERALALIKAANFQGGVGDSVVDFSINDTSLPTIAVIGIGKLDKLTSNLAKVAKATHSIIKSYPKAVIAWGDVICEKHFSQFACHLLGATYRFDTYKSKPAKADALTAIEFVNTKVEKDLYTNALDFVKAIITGQNLAKDVANDAPNIMNPSQLAKLAKQFGKEHGDVVNVSILGEKEMGKLGMGCFLAVSKGSDEEGKLIVIEYFGKSGKTKKSKLTAPIALVGKGITFDTGGISLKPAANMDEMKFDMGGAAAMFGTIKAVCEAKLPLDIVVVLACAENMPSGKASRPGDVVTAMNGTTVEIMNTDAEGRLVLCDALCYVQENYQPHTIIDTATLTGACVVALGSHRTGLYCNDEDLLFALESASELSDDLVWHMPLGDDYAAQLKSPVADLQNIGGPKGGSVTAACFLQHFIKEGTAWSHLDIAGTAWVSGENKGATGRPVPLLMHYLKSQVA